VLKVTNFTKSQTVFKVTHSEDLDGFEIEFSDGNVAYIQYNTCTNRISANFNSRYLTRYSEYDTTSDEQDEVVDYFVDYFEWEENITKLVGKWIVIAKDDDSFFFRTEDILGKKPTQSDLARHLGVNRATVSGYPDKKKELMLYGLWLKNALRE